MFDWIDMLALGLIVAAIMGAALGPAKSRKWLGGLAIALLGGLGGKKIAERLAKDEGPAQSTDSDLSGPHDVTPIDNPAADIEGRIRDAENEIRAMPDSDLDDLASEYDLRTTDAD